MATTYEPIATQTLGATATDVTFSSISGAFTDIILIVKCISTGSFYQIQVNGDTATNYSRTRLTGNGTTATSSRDSTAASIVINDVSTTVLGADIVQFQNYSNATTYKTVLYRNNLSSTSTGAGVGLWRSTSAITSIKVYPNTGVFSIGSTFTLYGIKAA
jgi:hypothetical protein